jgi:hypothetical protein
MTNAKEKEVLFASTLALVIVSGISLLGCNFLDRDKGAQEYYRHFAPIKYYAFKFCYSIIAISFAFNARFLLSSILIRFKNVILKKLN